MDKEERLQRYMEEIEIDRIVDRLGMPIDPGIKRAVAILMMRGFSTCASCEGHSDWGRSYPWIEIDSNCPKVVPAKNDEERKWMIEHPLDVSQSNIDPTENNRQFNKMKQLLKEFSESSSEHKRFFPWTNPINECYGRDFELRGYGINEFCDWLLERYDEDSQAI